MIKCKKCDQIFSRYDTLDRLHSTQCNSTEFEEVKNDSDIIKKLLEFYQKEIKQEDTNTLKVLLTGLSAFTTNPINSRILAPSSEGKTYIVEQVTQLFPSESLIILSSATPQSFKYSHGKEMIEENGELIPIEEKLEPLYQELEDIANKKDRKKIEKRIKKEVENLHAESYFLIDFTDKWLIFLDSQNQALWEFLKTILSHDRKDQKHLITNKVGGKNTQERIIIRGSPAVTYCSAKDESNLSISAEMDTRFDTIYLKNNPVKYKSSIHLTAKKSGLPNEIYEEEVVSTQEIEQSKELVNLLIDNVRKYGSTDHPIINPYSDKLATLFPNESGIRQRQFGRVMQMITIVTLCYSNLRNKVVIGDNIYPVVELSDVKKAVDLMKENSSLPTQKIQFFNDIFRPAFVSIATEIELVNEKITAVTANEIVEEIKKKHPKFDSLTRKKITETYLQAFVDFGALEESEDPRNRSRRIYWITSQYRQNPINSESPLIDTSTLDASCLESFVNKYLKWRFESGKITIIDSEDNNISLESLFQNLTLHKTTSIATRPPKNTHEMSSGDTTISGDLGDTKNE